MQMDLDPHLHRGGAPGRAATIQREPKESTRAPTKAPTRGLTCQGGVVMASSDDLRRARSSLAEAELAPRPSDRFLAAHLAALRVVAIVLTHRARRGIARPNGRPPNAWRMLAEVAPELAEWAAFFAATEAKR